MAIGSFPENLQIHPDQILHKDPMSASEELWIPAGRDKSSEQWKRYKISQTNEEIPELQGAVIIPVRIWGCVHDRRSFLKRLLGKKTEPQMEFLAPIGKDGSLVKVGTTDDRPVDALIVKTTGGEDVTTLFEALTNEYDPVETICNDIHIFRRRFRKQTEAKNDVEEKVGFDINQSSEMSPINLTDVSGVTFTTGGVEIYRDQPIREEWGGVLNIPDLPETFPPNENLTKDQLLDLYTTCEEPIKREQEKMAGVFEHAISIRDVDKSVIARFECLQSPEAGRLIQAFAEAEGKNIANTTLYLPQAPEGVSSFIGMSHSDLRLEEEAVSKDESILAMQKLLIRIHAQLYQLAHILRSNDSHSLLFHESIPYEHMDETEKDRRIEEFLASDIGTLIPNTEYAFLSEESAERFLADEKFLQSALFYLKRRDFHLLLRRDHFPGINGILGSAVNRESDMIDRYINHVRNPAMEYLNDGNKPPRKNVDKAIECCYDILDSIAVVSASQEKRDKAAFDRVAEFMPCGIPKLIFGHDHQLPQMELNKANNMGIFATRTVAAIQEQDTHDSNVNTRVLFFDERNNLYNRIAYFYLPFLFEHRARGFASYILNDCFAFLRKKGIPDEVFIR